MQQHPVPQNIMAVEFQLIGSMTIKQFIYVAAAAVLDGIIYASLPNQLPFTIIKWPFIAIFTLLGLGLAFVPINDLPLDRWIIAFIRSVTAPTKRIWRKEPKSLDYLLPTFITAPTQSSQPILRADRTKLDNYLKTVRTKKDASEPLEDYEKKFLSSLHFDAPLPAGVEANETQLATPQRQSTVTQNQQNWATPTPTPVVAAHHNGTESTYITKVGNTDQRALNPRMVAFVSPKLPVSTETPQVPASYVPQPPQKGEMEPPPFRKSPVYIAAAPPTTLSRVGGLEPTIGQPNPSFPSVDATAARLNELFGSRSQAAANPATPPAMPTIPLSSPIPPAQPTTVAVQPTAETRTQQPIVQTVASPIQQSTQTPSTPVQATPVNPLSTAATPQIPAPPVIKAPLPVMPPPSVATPTPQETELAQKVTEMGRYMQVMDRKYVTSPSHPIQQAAAAAAETARVAAANPTTPLSNPVNSNAATPPPVALAPQPQVVPQTTMAAPATATKLQAPPTNAPESPPQALAFTPQIIPAPAAIGRLAPPKPYYPNVISGWVKDQNGQFVSDAIVVIKDTTNSPLRALKSNKMGKFSITTPLPNGTYRIEAEKNGYNFHIAEVVLNGTILNPIEMRAV